MEHTHHQIQKVLSPTEKENKAQKDREDKTTPANLISNDQRTKQSSEEDKELVNRWTNSTSNGENAPGRWHRVSVNSSIN
ncbi:hypothetical protein [Mycoplasmopsis bovis]|uniref:hypothetical protein n=1 Tax=Mycoplasmopsis bovis TaxID=28903 RepID=UPI00249E8A52|nr:hypothetical protein [Mycoplasmopsis bovis]